MHEINIDILVINLFPSVIVCRIFYCSFSVAWQRYLRQLLRLVAGWGAWAQMSHARGVEIDRLVYVKCILYDGTTSGNYVCFYTSGSSDITAYSFHPPRR